MSLVAGRGPLSKDPAGWFSSPLPDAVVFVEPHPRRVQAVRHGQTVIDTERALMVHRRDHPLSYAFPVTPITAGGCDLAPYGSVSVGCAWLRLRTFSLLSHTTSSLLSGGKCGGPLHHQCP
jgi:hypothetical protein